MNDDLYYLNRFTGTDIVVDESDNGVVEKLNFTCASTQVSKNMFKVATQTISGMTITQNSDGGILLNGTSTATIIIANTLGLLAGISTALSCKISATISTNQLYIRTRDSGGALTKSINMTTGNTVISVIDTTQAYSTEFRIASGVTFNNLIVYPQLEYGTAVTSYVSYEPTPDYPVPIYSSGDGGKIVMWSHKKNMLDISTMVKGRLDSGVLGYASGTTSLSMTETTITMTTNTGYRGCVSDFIPVESSTQYRSPSNPIGGSVYVDHYDINKNWITRSGTALFTSPNNGKFVRISYQMNTAGTYTISNQMIEQGSTATTYEPYTGSITDITTPVGYIGGSLPNGVADSDTQKKIGKVVLAPANIYDYGVNAVSGIPFVRISKGSLGMSTAYIINGNMLMTSYKEKTSSTFNNTPSGYFNTYYDRYFVSIFDTRFTDLATAKTLLTGEIMYYELATPIDITLTKPPVSTYEGINTITTTNNVKPTLTIEAWKR